MDDIKCYPLFSSIMYWFKKPIIYVEKRVASLEIVLKDLDRLLEYWWTSGIPPQEGLLIVNVIHIVFLQLPPFPSSSALYIIFSVFFASHTHFLMNVSLQLLLTNSQQYTNNPFKILFEIESLHISNTKYKLAGKNSEAYKCMMDCANTFPL